MIFVFIRFGGGRISRSPLLDAIRNYFNHFDAPTRVRRSFALLVAAVLMGALLLGCVALGAFTLSLPRGAFGPYGWLVDLLFLCLGLLVFLVAVFGGAASTNWYCRTIRYKRFERQMWLASVVLMSFLGASLVPLLLLATTTGDMRRKAAGHAPGVN